MFNPKIKPMLFSTLKGYDKSKFLKDLIAGIIVAIIANTTTSNANTTINTTKYFIKQVSL